MGFVYREPNMAPHQFVVARFSVSCCTADAAVYGILVETDPKTASRLKKDTWIRVRGELHTMQMDDYDMVYLKAESIQTVKPPKDPYVYFKLDGPPVP